MVYFLLERRSSTIQASNQDNKSNSKRQTLRNSKSREFKQYLETSRVEIITLQKIKIMEKIQVKIGWSGKNYSCAADDSVLNGIVVVTNKTLEGLKKDIQESLQFHIEGCATDGDKLPEWLLNGEYELNYILETSALIHSLDGILTRSALSRATGINERQIGHYASGHRNPRPNQRERIIKGIHSISKELASVV
jgi:hypothetical protein